MSHDSRYLQPRSVVQIALVVVALASWLCVGLSACFPPVKRLSRNHCDSGPRWLLFFHAYLDISLSRQLTCTALAVLRYPRWPARCLAAGVASDQQASALPFVSPHFFGPSSSMRPASQTPHRSSRSFAPSLRLILPVVPDCWTSGDLGGPTYERSPCRQCSSYRRVGLCSVY